MTSKYKHLFINLSRHFTRYCNRSLGYFVASLFVIVIFSACSTTRVLKQSKTELVLESKGDTEAKAISKGEAKAQNIFPNAKLVDKKCNQEYVASGSRSSSGKLSDDKLSFWICTLEYGNDEAKKEALTEPRNQRDDNKLTRPKTYNEDRTKRKRDNRKRKRRYDEEDDYEYEDEDEDSEYEDEDYPEKEADYGDDDDNEDEYEEEEDDYDYEDFDNDDY